ncbi:hypothetical protein ABZW32_23830 [Streptomyces sp. NPDC004667]|uniref:hypothetical protein n=1 Tax=Streptomyces sp. NPDC004667 TaxID=3154285 RepID=UPI00339EF6B7
MRKEPHPNDAVTVETPRIKRALRPDDITETVPVPKIDPAADETAVLPSVRPDGPAGGPDARDASARTAPPSAPATRPTVRHSQESPADRVPPGIFRDSGNDVTRELPVVGDDGRPRRTPSDWAEATPMDDLPTLADELLGPRRDEEDGEDGRRGGGGPRRR